jgi:hypothetical protein
MQTAHAAEKLAAENLPPKNLPRKTSHGKIWGRNRNAMRKLILAGTILALAAGTHAFARGGFHGHSHGHFRHGGLRPANPTVPPSLTSDPRLTGNAPLPPHRQPKRGSASTVSEARDAEDIALDRKIGSICRGC